MLLKQLKQQGITIIMVTHDVEFAAEVSDRCGLFFDHEITSLDVPEEFSSFTIATGTAAAPFLTGLVQQAQARFPGLRGEVVAIDNDFFGHTIDVAGLLTGQDISAQLQKRPLGDRVLIPLHMLRHGETVFLDDYTVERLSQELGRPVQVVGLDGFDLADALFAPAESRQDNGRS